MEHMLSLIHIQMCIRDSLEHFALELLVEFYDKQGEAQPSETAKELSKKYKMIFVDEYQDTNLVQETILEMLLNKKRCV